MLLAILLYLICGAIAGFFAGLFGLGGGIIVIPSLLFIFSWQGIPQNTAMHLAVGTSIAIVFITSLISLLAHFRNNMIHVELFKKVFWGIMIGSSIGILLSSALNGVYLQVIFSAFLFMIAYRMGIKNSRAQQFDVEANQSLPSQKKLLLTSTCIYIFSGLLGLGGGLLMVPYLQYCGIGTRRAIATSTLCIIPAAFIGTIGFILTGTTDIPAMAFHSGFIYWPAFLGITATSMITVRWGVRLTQVISPVSLQKFFALFSATVGMIILLHSLQALSH